METNTFMLWGKKKVSLNVETILSNLAFQERINFEGVYVSFAGPVTD